MKGLSESAGLEASTVRKILDGSAKSTKLDTVERIAKALNCRPSELLPEEWQHTIKAIDSNILEQVIQDVATAIQKDGSEVTPKQMAIVIAALYERRLAGHSAPEAEVLQLFKK